MTNHGGKRKGAGRKPAPFIIKSVKLHFQSEDEYRRYLELPPRERVTMALKVVE